VAGQIMSAEESVGCSQKLKFRKQGTQKSAIKLEFDGGSGLYDHKRLDRGSSVSSLSLPLVL
jgi:hypothetical protein